MQERNYAYLNFKFLGSIPDPTRNPKFRGGARRGRHSIVQVFFGSGTREGSKIRGGAGFENSGFLHTPVPI